MTMYSKRAILSFVDKSAILTKLAAVGKDLARRCQLGLYSVDPQQAAKQDMVLGAARAAYKLIMDGSEPLPVLYALGSMADFWNIPSDSLNSLIARLEFITD